nr:hypothetical protein [Tanacetum cinerariifolium]
LGPLGLNKIVPIEVLCQSLQIELTPPVGSYNQEDVRRLSAHIVKLQDTPEGVLVLSGLSLEELNPRSDYQESCWKWYRGVFMIFFISMSVPKLRFRRSFIVILDLPYRGFLSIVPPAVFDVAIPNPTLEGLVASTPNAKVCNGTIIWKYYPTYLFAADSNEESDDNKDACVEIPIITPIRSAIVIPTQGNHGRGSAAPVVKGPSTHGIMTDVAEASSEAARRPWPSSNGVSSNSKFSRKEWDAPHQPTLKVLTKKVFKDPAVCKTIVNQFPTLGEMVQIEALSIDQLTTKMSVLHCMMMPHGGELLDRYHGLIKSYHDYAQSTNSRMKILQDRPRLRERTKKKIKSLTKNLDQLHAEVACLSVALNQVAVIEAEKDDEILRLKASPRSLFPSSEVVFRVWSESSLLVMSLAEFRVDSSLWLPVNKISDHAVDPLSVILHLELEKLARSSNVPILKDTRVPPPMGISHMVDGDVRLALDGSERVSFDPNDVVVALSLSLSWMERCWYPPFFKCWGGVRGMPENICCFELGEN